MNQYIEQVGIKINKCLLQLVEKTDKPINVICKHFERFIFDKENSSVNLNNYQANEFIVNLDTCKLWISNSNNSRLFTINLSFRAEKEFLRQRAEIDDNLKQEFALFSMEKHYYMPLFRSVLNSDKELTELFKRYIKDTIDKVDSFFEDSQFNANAAFIKPKLFVNLQEDFISRLREKENRIYEHFLVQNPQFKEYIFCEMELEAKAEIDTFIDTLLVDFEKYLQNK